MCVNVKSLSIYFYVVAESGTSLQGRLEESHQDNQSSISQNSKPVWVARHDISVARYILALAIPLRNTSTACFMCTWDYMLGIFSYRRQEYIVQN